MTSNPLANDPKGLWQNQQTEGQTMSIQDMRNMLSQRHAQTRRRRWLFGATFILYFVVSIAGAVSNERNVSHTGWFAVVRFALLITWILGFRYYVAERPMSLNLNAGSMGGLEFYRRELSVQLDYFQNVYRWLPWLLYVVLFFVTTLGTDPTLAIPLGILFAVFAAFWHRQWRRDLPRLKAEVEALEAFRKSQ